MKRLNDNTAHLFSILLYVSSIRIRVLSTRVIFVFIIKKSLTRGKTS